MDGTLKKKFEGIFVISYFSVQFDGKTNGKIKIAKFWNFRGVDCKFLNFRVKIKKTLKLYKLKMHFLLTFISILFLILKKCMS